MTRKAATMASDLEKIEGNLVNAQSVINRVLRRVRSARKQLQQVPGRVLDFARLVDEATQAIRQVEGITGASSPVDPPTPTVPTVAPRASGRSRKTASSTGKRRRGGSSKKVGLSPLAAKLLTEALTLPGEPPLPDALAQVFPNGWAEKKISYIPSGSNQLVQTDLAHDLVGDRRFVSQLSQAVSRLDDLRGGRLTREKASPVLLRLYDVVGQDWERLERIMVRWSAA